MSEDLEIIVNERLAENSIGQQMLANEQEKKLTELAINQAKVPLSNNEFNQFDDAVEFLNNKVEDLLVKWSQKGPTEASIRNIQVAAIGVRHILVMHTANKLSGKECVKIMEIATALHNGLWEEAKKIHLSAVGANVKRESWCWLRGLRCLIQACIDLPNN